MRNENSVQALDGIELLSDEQAREVVGGPTAVEYAFPQFSRPARITDGTSNTLL